MEEPQDPKVRIRQEQERLKLTRGKLIRRARELLGLSQEELAPKINAVANTVSRWEREAGQRPDLFHQRYMAEVFGLEVGELGYLQESDDQTSQVLTNVPFRRNHYFTGYDEVIKDLHDRLVAEKDGVAIEAISGLGGIGKTQLMLEYAFRYRKEYQKVFWIRADTQELLEVDLAQAAMKLQVPEARKQQPNHQYLVTEAKQWFRKHSGWLLLLDNVEEDVQVKDILSGMPHGHVLLTTRSQAVAELASNLQLDKMRPEVGALLLLRRALPPSQPNAVDTFSEAHRLEAREISLLLDGLPLALDQAGAYIGDTGCSLTEYIQLYHKHRKELLLRRSEREKLYTDYRESVATTWLISFSRVEQQCSAAAKLLHLCAFLHPDAIPVDILLAGTFLENTEMRPIVDDALQFNQAREVLLRYSLIRRNAGANLFSIHRLVQAVLQDRMDDQTQHLWAERAVHAVEKAFVSAHSERVEYYIPQATLCADLIQQWELAGDEVTRLLECVAREVYKRGCYSQGLTLFQSAQGASSASRGSDDPRTIQLASELGRVYIDLGNYRMAMNLCAQARQDFERILGADHPAVVDCLNNLALAAMRAKKLATATQFSGQAYVWYPGLSEPIYAAEKATTYYITAEIAAQLGPEGIAYAEDYYLDALDIAIQAWGRGSAKFSDILGGLGRLYTRYRKFEQSEQVLRQALEIRRSVFGHDHPRVADSLADLAELAHCQGDLAAAEQFYKQALAIRLEKLGLYHPEVAQTFRALAGLAWHQGKGNEAMQMFTYAFIYYGSLNDLKSPDYLSLLSEWTAFSRNRGWVKEADACEQEVASTTKLIERRREILSNLIPKEKPDPIACFLQSLAFRRKRVIDDSTSLWCEMEAVSPLEKPIPLYKS
jgi:tetratricopeptide (TPR) repeat protein/transcriptional regulator with XRE-family HTH domain